MDHTPLHLRGPLYLDDYIAIGFVVAMAPIWGPFWLVGRLVMAIVRELRR